MSRAEIFKIIDVLSDSAPPPASSGEDGRPSGDHGKNRDHLALWTSPAEQAALAVLPSPPPLIDLKYAEAPDLRDDRLLMLREPESARARSFRLLRHRLLARDDPRIVAVTSASAGEGKTTCAVNLAVALAEDNMMRVLLLEANLRRPALGRLLGFEPDASFVEHITRFTEVGPPYPVVALSGTRLHVAALPLVALPDARLDRTLFSVALHDLREAYDYIVIDAGSVLESADADVVGECSNGVVMATRTSVSRRGDVRRAIEQLAPAIVLGSVLLDADA
jgi:Mrp family chromosome partitioning ATPase